MNTQIKHLIFAASFTKPSFEIFLKIRIKHL